MIIFYRFLFVCLFAVTAAPAMADVFVWQHHETGASVTFPDRWAVVGNQKSDDVLTIAAPGQRDFASCRMRIRDEGRFTIYPRKFDAALQRMHVSQDFWQQYFAEYDGTQIYRAYDGAGLGDATASRVEVGFITPGSPKMLKRGIVQAGLYDNKLYVFECSAENGAYLKWRPVFTEIFKSVDIGKPSQPPLAQTLPLRVHGKRPVDMYTY